MTPKALSSKQPKRALTFGLMGCSTKPIHAVHLPAIAHECGRALLRHGQISPPKKPPTLATWHPPFYTLIMEDLERSGGVIRVHGRAGQEKAHHITLPTCSGKNQSLEQPERKYTGVVNRDPENRYPLTPISQAYSIDTAGESPLLRGLTLPRRHDVVDTVRRGPEMMGRTGPARVSYDSRGGRHLRPIYAGKITRPEDGLAIR